MHEINQSIITNYLSGRQTGSDYISHSHSGSRISHIYTSRAFIPLAFDHLRAPFAAAIKGEIMQGYNQQRDYCNRGL